MKLDLIVAHASTIAISGHVNPDGDCVGSCLGLYNYLKLKYPEKEVDVYLEPIPRKFDFLQGACNIKNHFEDEKVYDMYFSLDCAGGERLGFAQEAYERAKIPCCIDHHISNDAQNEYAYVVPEASSTCELVYDLIGIESITKEIGECLYLGMAHDTGVFQYSNVSPSTMRAAASLLELGVQGSKIIENTYYEKRRVQLIAMGKAFLESQFYLDGKCIAYGITHAEMEEIGATKQDLEAIVSELRVVQGVEIAVFMYELKPGIFKVSLRSTERIDASKIAIHFDGGGHKKAAGCTLEGQYRDLLGMVLKEIELQI